MRQFWKYQVQYRTAKGLMDAGLWLMPSGRYKTELLGVLWQLRAKVRATNRETRAARVTAQVAAGE